MAKYDVVAEGLTLQGAIRKFSQLRDIDEHENDGPTELYGIRRPGIDPDILIIPLDGKFTHLCMEKTGDSKEIDVEFGVIDLDDAMSNSWQVWQRVKPTPKELWITDENSSCIANAIFVAQTLAEKHDYRTVVRHKEWRDELAVEVDGLVLAWMDMQNANMSYSDPFVQITTHQLASDDWKVYVWMGKEVKDGRS